MAIKINGDNSTSAVGLTSGDDDSGIKPGTNQVEIVTGGTARVTVNGSSATFDGNVQAGGNPNSAGATGTQLNTTAGLWASAASGTTSVFRGYTTGTDVITSRINANGSANFASGNITMSNEATVFLNTSETNNNAVIRVRQQNDNSNKFSVTGDGAVFINGTRGATNPVPGISLNANGIIAVADGGGIDFSADGNNNGMTSELLDDYEEGTWTATLAATNATFTTIAQVVRYTKIGNTVHLHGYVQIHCSAGAGANNVSLEGLPFPATSVNNFNQGGVGTSVNRLDNSNGNVLHFLLQPNGSSLNMRTFDNVSSETRTRNINSNDVTQANFSFQLEMSYQTSQ